MSMIFYLIVIDINQKQQIMIKHYVGLADNQWEAIIEIISNTDDPENWNLIESIKEQIYPEINNEL